MLKHSQNLFNNTKILDECFKHVSIPGGQLVIEIGGGKGIITDNSWNDLKRLR
jgi:16S rRNA A1518/A1519 N6-dimethyltransferase RsmA/KsgA/DIM1 with predicted DNA glycosylase/AP lyase activity